MNFFELTFNVSDVILIVGFAIIVIKFYNKIDVRLTLLESKEASEKDSIKTLKEDFKGHIDQTPVCMKRFEDLNLEISKINTEEHLKSEYQQQIVEKILQPILRQMTTSLKEYTDVKTGILTREIECIRQDSNAFKTEIKILVKEIGDENHKMLETLINILTQKAKN